MVVPVMIELMRMFEEGVWGYFCKRSFVFQICLLAIVIHCGINKPRCSVYDESCSDLGPDTVNKLYVCSGVLCLADIPLI